MKGILQNLSRCLILITFGLAAGGTAGCSSPDMNGPCTNLKLNQIRQAPGGQLALIFDETRGQPPGQRVLWRTPK